MGFASGVTAVLNPGFSPGRQPALSALSARRCDWSPAAVAAPSFLSQKNNNASALSSGAVSPAALFFLNETKRDAVQPGGIFSPARRQF